MKILIVTVAGMSTRFSQSLGRECVKCLYYKRGFSESLLYRLLHQPVTFDKYIIVGGYRYEELQAAVRREFPAYAEKIVLVNNKSYQTYGSGYSLFCGLMEAMKFPFSEVVFAEGDLYVDAPSFAAVCGCGTDVITCNRDPITADRSVAFYFDLQGKVHYIYDTGHSALEIDEPFLEIRNSGQIWKFANAERLRETVRSMPEESWQATNLVLIQRYFGGMKREQYSVLPFEKWINCNTVEDFDRIS